MRITIAPALYVYPSETEKLYGTQNSIVKTFCDLLVRDDQQIVYEVDSLAEWRVTLTRAVHCVTKLLLNPVLVRI